MPLCVFLLALSTSVLSAPATSNEGWFWHVTDFHLDSTYADKRLSCKEELSEPGIYGDDLCDSPWLLCQDAVQAMKNIKQNVDFIIWTGDNVLHGDDDDLSVDFNVDTMKQLTELLEKTFPGVPIYPTLGNHDFWPASQFPDKPSPFYKKVFEYWRKWISHSEQQKTFEKGGYYTLKTLSGLRIIALNTNLYDTMNRQTSHLSDPADQLAWLDEVLQKADENAEKVMIIGHIPPGVHSPKGDLWMHSKQSGQFDHVILKYAHVIVAMHFGHEHADRFRLYYNSNDEPVIPVFIAPSITPWHGSDPSHDPGVRLISYDRNSGNTLEIVQFYMDLQKSNSEGESTWMEKYTMTHDYEIPELSAKSIYELIKEMEKENSSEFKKYNKWQMRGVPGNTAHPCDQLCKDAILCGFTISPREQFEKCLEHE